ncbi:hypothetical protein E2320_016973 [Naja naja]|nr:hypothetical protein E2320_016973 [Naja naja]
MFLFEKEFFPAGLPEWAKVFWILLMAFEVGISSYPFFVCLLTKYEIVGAVLGFLYTAAWAVAMIFDILDCSRNDNDKDSLMEEYQLQYVQQLLRKPVLRNPQKNWFRRRLYQWDPYFKFPTRLINTIVVMFLCLYMFIGFEFLLIKSLITALKLVATIIKNPSSALGHGSWVQAFEEFIRVLEGIWIVTTVISSATCIGYTFNILARYRIYERVIFSKRGYLIMHLVQWLFGMIFMYVLILPMIHGKWMELLNKWGTVILTFIIVVVIKEIQVFVGGKFFLQPKMSPGDSQKPLALDNRRVFINFSYFLFFHSVIVGLTSCLMRLFHSIIIGVWLVGRIDRPVMPKGYEQYDAGYTVWIGMLFLDHYHTNPILVCFCQILCDKLKQKQLSANSYLSVYKPLEVVPRVSSKARTRWFLLYTLLNNPSVQKVRKLKPLSYSVD